MLIIEDDDDTRQALSIRLTASGFDTVAAADAVSGMTMAVRERPDAIVLDLRLPGGDGLMLLERLRSNSATAGAAVIVLSARHAEAHAARALKAGAVAFLQKPADNAALLAAIRSASGTSA